MVGRRERVIDGIREQIASGQLKPGQALPSIAQLAEQYTTSTATVKMALAVLRETGEIRGEQGVATYVAEPKSRDR